MTVIRFKRASRLSTLIDQTGGVSVGAAVQQAARNLAPMKAEGLKIAGDLVTELEALPARATSEQAQSHLEETYRIGLAILDAVGPFDLPYLQKAAWGLCDLSDGYDPDRPFDWRVVQVHVQALRLFVSAEPDTPAGAFDQIIDSLDKAAARQRTV